jgi:hypothetical protein
VTRRFALASVWLLVSCTPQTDVVAYTPSLDAQPEAPPLLDAGDLPETAPSPFSCDPLATSSIVAYANTGLLLAYDPIAEAFTSLGPAGCMMQGLPGMALRSDGSVWMVDATGQVFVAIPKQACTPLPLKLTPPAFTTFLLIGASETLYAATGDNVLVAIDPQSFIRSPIAPFAVGPLAALTGTWDGRLEATTEAVPPPGVTVFTVSPGDGSIESKVYFDLEPNAGNPSLLTAASWGPDLYVFDDHAVYDFRPAAGQIVSSVTIPPFAEGIVGVASSICASRPR